MKPIKSIKARYQSYIIDNFNKSKYAKQFTKFYQIHNGQTCFIIGNGPSLRAKDLTLLYKNNIPTFAFNRIYYMFNKTDWRPTYYVSQDEKMLLGCKEEVDKLPLDNKFIPIQLKFYYDIEIKNANYFNMQTKEKVNEAFSEDISKYVVNSNTVAYTAAQLAVYMGFKKIYLIGVDHNFSVVQNDKGEIIKDDSVKDYFAEEYNHDKKDLYIPNLDESTRTFITMKKYCDEHEIEVYNATRGGKLEVFPRVDFNEVMKKGI